MGTGSPENLHTQMQALNQKAPDLGPVFSYTEKLSEPRSLTPQPLRAVKPSPASSAGGGPPSSPLNEPHASPATEAQERAQHPQVTA